MDIYYSPNLFPLLPLISAFICPIFVAEHLCNVRQFDILAQKILNLQSFIKFYQTLVNGERQGGVYITSLSIINERKPLLF